MHHDLSVPPARFEQLRARVAIRSNLIEFNGHNLITLDITRIRGIRHGSDYNLADS